MLGFKIWEDQHLGTKWFTAGGWREPMGLIKILNEHSGNSTSEVCVRFSGSVRLTTGVRYCLM